MLYILLPLLNIEYQAFTAFFVCINMYICRETFFLLRSYGFVF